LLRSFDHLIRHCGFIFKSASLENQMVFLELKMSVNKIKTGSAPVESRLFVVRLHKNDTELDPSF
jgi:hypothetical protein